ncbi:MAG: CapA family protein [Firmicutes bacterium]|nr:CapA family protein [Bacillota bacterium]
MLGKLENKKKLCLSLILIETIAVFLLAFLTLNKGIGFLPTFLPRENIAVTESQTPEQQAGCQNETAPAFVGINDKDRGISINLVGDIMLASRVGTAVEKHGPQYPWSAISDILSAADVTIGNLECAVGSGHYRPDPDKQFAFLANPEALKGARDAGVNVLTLANNHVLDFGPEALLDTIFHLENNGIKYTGAGANIDGALTPVIMERNGVTVGVLAFSYVIPRGWWVAGHNRPGTTSGHDYEQVYESVRDLSQKTNITVVSLHWGRELADRPSKQQQKLARRLVDLGADIILGHHPHVLQGLEQYKNSLIIYSAGNFIFTLSGDVRGRQSMILQVDAAPGGLTGVRIHPAWLEFGHTIPANETQTASIIRRLQKLSAELGTTVNDRGEIEF